MCDRWVIDDFPKLQNKVFKKIKNWIFGNNCLKSGVIGFLRFVAGCTSVFGKCDSDSWCKFHETSFESVGAPKSSLGRAQAHSVGRSRIFGHPRFSLSFETLASSVSSAPIYRLDSSQRCLRAWIRPFKVVGSSAGRRVWKFTDNSRNFQSSFSPWCRGLLEVGFWLVIGGAISYKMTGFLAEPLMWASRDRRGRNFWRSRGRRPFGTGKT